MDLIVALVLAASASRSTSIDWGGLLTTSLQALTVLLAFGSLIVAYRTLREGRTVIAELRELTAAAAQQTAAQNAIVVSLEAMVHEAKATANLLDMDLQQAEALADLESVGRVAFAIGEVRQATFRVLGGQPPFVFKMAQEQLRAAMIGRTRDMNLPSVSVMLGANEASGAAPHLDPAVAQVMKEMEGARDRLREAGRPAQRDT